MRPSITVWRPDTCDCVIEIHYDADEPEAGRTHEYVARTPCGIHAPIAEASFERRPESLALDSPSERRARPNGKAGDHRALACLDDNRRKNLVMETLKGAIPELEDEEVEWSLAPNRVIHVRAKRHSQALRAALAERFGDEVLVL